MGLMEAEGVDVCDGVGGRRVTLEEEEGTLDLEEIIDLVGRRLSLALTDPLDRVLERIVGECLGDAESGGDWDSWGTCVQLKVKEATGGERVV